MIPSKVYIFLYSILNVGRAFKLPVSRVIHTVGPIYDMDKHPEVSLKNAYE
jgi:hypothetical protein